jgi:hypothetical protein
MRYQNLFINSYNKTSTDTNYDYNLAIPEHDISCGENEEISLTITNFNTPNIFYNITENNNKFYFKTITGGTTTIATMAIPVGNYDVYTLAAAMDLLIVAEGHIAYVPLINKFSFEKKNSSNTTQVFFNIFSDLYKILNVPQNIDINMLPNITSYSGLINMNRFNYLLIYINGITCYNQNISNITNSQFKLSNLVAIINRADVLPYGNICYVEINQNNEILLGNKKISNLNIKITNEYGELLTDLDNWTMTLKFVFAKKI